MRPATLIGREGVIPSRMDRPMATGEEKEKVGLGTRSTAQTPVTRSMTSAGIDVAAIKSAWPPATAHWSRRCKIFQVIRENGLTRLERVPKEIRRLTGREPSSGLAHELSKATIPVGSVHTGFSSLTDCRGDFVGEGGEDFVFWSYFSLCHCQYSSGVSRALEGNSEYLDCFAGAGGTL